MDLRSGLGIRRTHANRARLRIGRKLWFLPNKIPATIQQTAFTASSDESRRTERPSKVRRRRGRNILGHFECNTVIAAVSARFTALAGWTREVAAGLDVKIERGLLHITAAWGQGPER